MDMVQKSHINIIVYEESQVLINLKTIGLVGGMSWESTLEYYKIINDTVKAKLAKLGGLHSAQSMMYSVDFEEIEVLQHKNKWEKLTDIMVDASQKLKNGGADFIVICTNTIHKMANDIQERTGMKVLHIAEATGKKVIEKGIKKVGLLGTKFTMEQDFYKKILEEHFNVNVIIPDESDRKIIHKVIYGKLCKGIIDEVSKMKYIKIINKLALNGAEGIILGCTEIPLLIKQEDISIPIFDTTKIHAVSAVEFALKR